MVIGLLGLTGSGKSTCASAISDRLGAILFDMDNEFPEEYRDRNRQGEVVTKEDVKVYQREIVERLISLAKGHTVVFAGFFFDKVFPELINKNTETIWINLYTGNIQTLKWRVKNRKDHFVHSVDVIEDNWPHRKEMVIGDDIVNADQEISKVIEDCLKIISKHDPKASAFYSVGM